MSVAFRVEVGSVWTRDLDNQAVRIVSVGTKTAQVQHVQTGRRAAVLVDSLWARYTPTESLTSGTKREDGNA